MKKLAISFFTVIALSLTFSGCGGGGGGATTTTTTSSVDTPVTPVTPVVITETPITNNTQAGDAKSLIEDQFGAVPDFSRS
jgi:ABC-type glycerol-3-phosphate transport system substrate-binding protein